MRLSLKKTICVFLCLILFFSLFPGQARGEAPGVSAEAAVLMDQTSGRLLFEKNSREKLPIASITKVMTAILAIESGKMNDRITVSRKAASTEGSSIYLKPGEKMKLKDLVYGMMLRSGNDASLAIAEALGESEAGFSFLMNEKAQELGMADTHFMNPNGLHHPDHYSTAYDMAVLTKYCMGNPLFRKIFQTKIYRAPETNKEGIRVWRNKNKLLTLFREATGGKTGFTKMAGRTLISTAEKGRFGLIAVTLNDGDDWKDHIGLYDWAFSEYQRVKVVQKGKIRGPLNAFYKDRVFISRPLFLPLSKDEQRRVTKKIVLMRPPKHAERWVPPSPAGRLKIMLDREEIASLPLYYRPPKKKDKGLWHVFYGYFAAIVSGREGPPS
ncbi:D-alanyl-D-alanine carboxypeptidase [Sporolactobacillus sp. THM7-7]|nr:D-alanyl-D-alanine carboxypeptidase [Sporolactobacillus sp. THM7-7]